MLFDRYQQQGLFFNMNFKEKTNNGQLAYRGDLVLVEGEVADSSGRRKPPTASVHHAALLGSEDKLLLVAGLLDDVAALESFTARYAPDFAPEVKLLFFVTNIGAPMQVELGAVRASLLPIEDGLAWNELLEEVRLDKDDLKGQSSAEKVVTVYKAFTGYKPRGELVPLATALTRTVEAKRSRYGAV